MQHTAHCVEADLMAVVEPIAGVASRVSESPHDQIFDSPARKNETPGSAWGALSRAERISRHDDPAHLSALSS